MADERKTGVYICSDCGIGEALDTEKLEKVATDEQHAAVCRTAPFLCSDEGVELIKSDINSEGVNNIVVAACSQRVHTDKFDYDPLLYVTERVNLREQVVWSQPAGEETTQELAEDQLRMGIVRANKSLPPEPNIQDDLTRTTLVIGGGVAGMTAALESAAAGYDVVLVEKEDKLGGWAAKMYKILPTKAPWADLDTSHAHKKAEAVMSNPKIDVRLNTKIDEISDEPGKYKVTLTGNGTTDTIDIGSIVMATGWRPYENSEHNAEALKKDFLYEANKNVITGVQMEALAKENDGKILRPSDGRPAKRAAIILCAHQRDEEHLPYCSSVCCLTSLKQALYVAESDPAAAAYVIYKDMRTPGQYEEFYKNAQNNPGVMLTKGEVAGIAENSDGSLTVDIDNSIMGEKVQIEADMVVLATGMESSMVPPDRQVNDLTPEYIGQWVETTTQDGVIREVKADPIILNLKYRQGPELPHLNYGFPDSHFICFPYETRRTGIYTAGCVRQPMDGLQAAADAKGAALKALQCVELTAQGKAVHPRSGDMTFPEFNLSTCTQCRRCTVECPFGVLDEDEKGTPEAHPNRCRRCGVCMGACPQRIISFKNYSVDMVASMMKAIEVPDSDDKPRILALICENDAYPAFDIAGLNRIQLNPYYRYISLRCLGGTNLVWIADALSRGIEGIILIGCKFGDDYQCHFIKGSQMANERMGKVQETLGRLMLEAERVKQVELPMNEWDTLPQILDDFAAKLKEFGPNPFKGF